MTRFAIGFALGAFTAAWVIGWLLSAQRVVRTNDAQDAVPDPDLPYLTATYPWLEPQTTVSYS